MVGIIIITHGEFGSQLLEVAQTIAGQQERIVTISQSPDDSLKSLKEKIETNVKKLNLQDGCLVLTDLAGGTPMNASVGLLKQTEVEIVTGVNLPMLLEVFANRDRSPGVRELAQIASEKGRKGILIVRELIKN